MIYATIEVELDDFLDNEKASEFRALVEKYDQLDVDLEGDFSQYQPAVMYLRNGDPGYPAEYPELIDMRISVRNPDTGVYEKIRWADDVFTPPCIDAMENALYKELESGD